MPDTRLTPDQTSIRRMAGEFARQEILPVAWYYDEEDFMPLDILKKAFEAGILSADIPARYGGRGYRLLDVVMMIEEIAAASPGIAMSIFDNSLSIAALICSRNEELKTRFLKDVASTFKLICFPASEPVVAEIAADCRCRAEAREGGYILNGTQYSVINGGIADYMCVFAGVGTSGGASGIGAFLVDLASPGVSVIRPVPRPGQRRSLAAGITFNNVFVPAGGVMAGPAEGPDLAAEAFSRIRTMVSALAVGTARSAMEFAADHADRRRGLGMTLADIAAIEQKLAGMQKKLVAARLLTWKSAWELDKDMDRMHTPSMEKIYAMTWELANDAMQIFGDYGCTRMMAAEQRFRDIRLLRIRENICEIQRIVLACAVMNSPGRPRQPSRDAAAVGKKDVIAGTGGFFRRRCRTCGNVYYGRKPHTECPYCFFPRKIFPPQPSEAEQGDERYHEMHKGKGGRARPPRMRNAHGHNREV